MASVQTRAVRCILCMSELQSDSCAVLPCQPHYNALPSTLFQREYYQANKAPEGARATHPHLVCFMIAPLGPTQ
jgi:hypothetical protein